MARIVEDAVRGTLKEVYAPVDDFGQERKPSLQPYPEIPWTKSSWSNSICSWHIASVAQALGRGWERSGLFHWSPGAVARMAASFAR